jgi:hypothetical protein
VLDALRAGSPLAPLSGDQRESLREVLHALAD